MASNNIMIYRIGSLGDTVMALPAFNRIRELFPKEKILLLSNKPVVSKAAAIELVLGNHFFFDDILNYPVNTRNFKVLFQLILQIRRHKIKTLFYLTPCTSRKRLRRDVFFFKLAGITSFAAIPEIEADFTLVKDTATNAYEWEAKRISRRLHTLGAFDFNDEKYWNLQLTDAELSSGRAFLNHLPIKALSICFSIGTKCDSNHWGLQNWGNLLRSISIQFPESNLIGIGSSDESKDVAVLLKNLSIQTLNLCGKTTPRQSAAILQSANLFIGHDSGPLHLAASVGAPCVAIYSARNLPGQWYPKGNSSKVIYHEVECAGCRLEVCVEQKKKCISSISPEEVMIEVNNLLAINYHN